MQFLHEFSTDNPSYTSTHFQTADSYCITALCECSGMTQMHVPMDNYLHQQGIRISAMFQQQQSPVVSPGLREDDKWAALKLGFGRTRCSVSACPVPIAISGFCQLAHQAAQAHSVIEARDTNWKCLWTQCGRKIHSIGWVAQCWHLTELHMGIKISTSLTRLHLTEWGCCSFKVSVFKMVTWQQNSDVIPDWTISNRISKCNGDSFNKGTHLECCKTFLDYILKEQAKMTQTPLL